MEFSIDVDIQGEVYIPFKYNNTDKSNNDNNDNSQINKEAENSNASKKNSLFENISKTNYLDYRCVLFQGELLKFYVILKLDKENEEFCKKILENMYFKVEFQSMEMRASDVEQERINNMHNFKEEEYQLTLSDLFTINSDKIRTTNDEYENVLKKEYIQKNKLMVYEIFKQIIVPKNYLDSMLIMKVHLMSKNEISYTREINALDFYQSGYYETVAKFKILKTLFKEVKIIRPLIVSQMKQIDLLLDVSLVQAKFENTTGLTNFQDNSLKFSKFLSKEKLEQSEELISKGMIMNIQDIQILKDETTLDENLTSNISKIKEIYLKNDRISLTNINFSIYNTELPVCIRPGEEYNLTLKILKTAFLNEKSDNKNKDQQNLAYFDTNTRNQDAVSENSLTFAESQILKTRVLTQTNREPSEDSRDDQNDSEQDNTTENKENSNIFGMGIGGFIKNIFMPTQTNEESKINKDTEKDFETLENFKIYFMTPIILNVASNMFYENLFMCLQIKWNNEINRFLKIECIVPKDIYLHEYFDICLKCRNISSSEMNLCIEVPDTFEGMKLNEGLYHAKNVELFPSVISQTKFQNLGIFGCNENKVLTLKYLALKNGFTQLPNFILIDTISGKRFYISHNNKILVKKREN